MSADFGGLSSQYKYYEFELDSVNYSTPAQGDVSPVDWPIFQIGGKRPLRNIAAIKILEVQIPFSFYTIDEINNTFVFEETTGGPQVITIPPGNYNTTELAALLVVKLNAAKTSLFTYTIVADPITQKFTFSNGNTGVSSPFTFTFGTTTDQGLTNPRTYLGFEGGIVTSVNTSGLQDSIVSPNTYNVTGPDYLFVNSDKVGSLTNLYLPRGATAIGNCNAGPQLAKIPVNVNRGNTIFWSDPDPGKWFDLECLASLTEIDFYITLGPLSNPLQLNGRSFSLKLGILEDDPTRASNMAGNAASRVVKRVRTK